MPVNDAGWQSVTLPHRVPKPVDRDLVGYWYRASFTLSHIQQPLWLYFPKLRSGGTIFVNGIEVGEIRGADQLTQVRWFRPHLFFLPKLSLRQGSNQIAVRFAIREPLTSFGEFSVGLEPPLRDAYERLLLWENTSTEISSSICFLVGAFILIFWVRRRQEQLYGIFGLCLLFWGLRTFIFRMPEVPMTNWLAWRFFYYVTTAGFIVYMTMFLLKFSEIKLPAVNRFLTIYWLAGCFAFLLIGAPARSFMDAYWISGFLPLTVFAIIRLTIFSIRVRTPSSIAMVLAIIMALGLTLHDLAVQHGLFHLQEFYLLHLGIPAFLLVMGWLLSTRFLESLKQVESANELLASRVAARELELTASHEHLRKLERIQATTEERQRIMQDMHDGVGSQILSTLVMVQRGAATQDDMVILLQECLDDMRLAIDSLSPHEPDLLPVLGNFRFRMESRFKGVGIRLNWRNHDMPDSFEMAPHAALHLLRILQESLANVLKHAQAKNVMADLNFSARSLCIQIADDGIGFDSTAGLAGQGITNMRARAQKIGANISIRPTPSGTVIRLDIPIGAGMGSEIAA